MPETTANGPLRRILIVGGGTAGWMTAAILRRATRRLGTAITLVESPDIGTIGVGEATIPSLVQFVRAMRYDEEAFMRACSASYKLGIRFNDWVRKGQEYWHPFGLAGGRIDGLDLFHFWLRKRLVNADSEAYGTFAVQHGLSLEERAPRPFSGTSPVIETGGYAYHLDAAGLATFLREQATAEGVEHIFGEVEEVVRRADGGIDRVRLVGEREIVADLYIDCTGFAGVLAEKALGDPWIDWSHLLLCDRAVVMPLPRTTHFPPYTRSTALDAGWLWQIPLSSRTGTGYVYSSAHISADAAAAALIANAGLRRARAADPRQLRIRVGRRTTFWQHNCVAIGLAGGFIEPLESTGIHLIQRGVEHLVEMLPDRQGDEALRRGYNRIMGEALEEVRDFIILHYYVSQRDEPFWREARAVPLPDSLKELLALYDANGTIGGVRHHVFRDPSYYYILAGGERLPRRPAVAAEGAELREIDNVFARIRKQNRVFVDQMPTHRDTLAKLHRQAL